MKRSILQKWGCLSLAVFLAVNFCGCLMVGAEINESRKAVQVVNISYGQVVDVIKKAIREHKVQFVSAMIKNDMVTVRGVYNNEVVYVRVFKISGQESRIEVYVGTNETGKKSARDILDGIVRKAAALP
jgi:hypothetical protein